MNLFPDKNDQTPLSDHPILSGLYYAALGRLAAGFFSTLPPETLQAALHDQAAHIAGDFQPVRARRLSSGGDVDACQAAVILHESRDIVLYLNVMPLSNREILLRFGVAQPPAPGTGVAPQSAAGRNKPLPPSVPPVCDLLLFNSLLFW